MTLIEYIEKESGMNCPEWLRETIERYFANGDGPEPVDDTISRQAVIDAIVAWTVEDRPDAEMPTDLIGRVRGLTPAQSDIKQAAKLLSDFIESCPGGDSYLITPDGENLRTDWGYAAKGIQLIHDWAERRTDG